MSAEMSGITSEMLERQKLTTEGMAQFELLHSPARAPALIETNGVEHENMVVVCRTCKVDWPCERMGMMLLVQGLAMLQSMIPSGNMANILGRFSGGGKA